MVTLAITTMTLSHADNPATATTATHITASQYIANTATSAKVSELVFVINSRKEAKGTESIETVAIDNNHGIQKNKAMAKIGAGSSGITPKNTYNVKTKREPMHIILTSHQAKPNSNRPPNI